LKVGEVRYGKMGGRGNVEFGKKGFDRCDQRGFVISDSRESDRMNGRSEWGRSKEKRRS